MAGGADLEAQYKFTGWKYYYNSYTNRGRFNVIRYLKISHNF